MSDTLRPPAKCGPHDRAAILRNVARDCDDLVVAIIRETGWTQLQIAVRLGCSERALANWRMGDAEPGHGRVIALRLLLSEVRADTKQVAGART